MNITRNNIDDLNATLTVSIEKEDYKDKVEKALNSYRKSASIKGFRKGQVPMSFVRKQYEQSLIFDEVNKLLQTGINEYLQKENISILGNPLPKENESFDWDANPLNFEFELGLAPEFKVDLSKISVEAFKINVGEEEVQKYIDNFSQRYGSMKTLEKVEEKANIRVKMRMLDNEKNEVEQIFNEETFLFADELAKPKKFIGKKVGDVITVKKDELNDDDIKLEQILGGTKEQIKDFDGLLEFTIDEISVIEPSEIDQSLFDKVYGENVVKSEEEFRNKIKEEAEKMYERDTDQQMMNDVVAELIEKIKFDLPNDFLSRWLHFSNENLETVEDAAEQLKKEEEGLRYQLIESQLAETYDLKVEAADVEEATRAAVREQLKMYGQTDMPDEDLNRIVQGSLQNEQEFRRMADKVFSDKLKKVFKENVKIKEKKVSFDEFVEIMEKKHEEHHHHHHDHDHDHEHDHNHAH